MNKKIVFSFAACLFSVFVGAQNIHPFPDSIVTPGGNIALTAGYRIKGAEKADSDAVSLLKNTLKQEKVGREVKIIIGKRGDRLVKKYTKHIPYKSGAYYLSVIDREVIIAGHDDRGTFYGVQTFSQLLQNHALPKTTIIDVPDIANRGVVEGFYGTPWSHRDRISLLKYFGKNKLNTYIYGPKDDPYHSSPNWREPYPESEAAQIKELVKTANANKVDFVWAIHPGKDIKWNDEDRSALIRKFENMYDLGVRAYAVFFDDISGEGTNPVKQAELLNYIDEQFIQKKPDLNRLVMCPTEYNKSWSNPKEGSYLDILGNTLHKNIEIMWTGDRVISDITKEGMNYINKRIKRPAYIWWNFPVSDYVRDHLLMGPSYGIATDIAKQMSGFVSNPMERAEASKIAIYSIASYAWNLSKYDPNKAWEEAIKDIMPTDAPHFRTFAAHNSDLGPNGHGYRRDESVELKPVIEKFVNELKGGKYDENDYTTILNEFKNISLSARALITSRDNTYLIEEIKPWLLQFDLLGQRGVKAMELVKMFEKDKTVLFWNKDRDNKEIEKEMETIDKTYNQNPYQPGVKTGTLVLSPMIDSTLKIIENQYYTYLKGDNAAPVPAKTTRPLLKTDIAQVARQPLQFKEKTVSVSPALEVIKVAPQQSLALILPILTESEQIDINPGIATTDWIEVEYSTDETDWKKIDLQKKEDGQLTASLKGTNLKAIRLINKSEQEQEMYLKQFALTTLLPLASDNNIVSTMDADLNSYFTLGSNETIAISNTQMWNNFTHIIHDNSKNYKLGDNMPDLESVTLLTSHKGNTNITLFGIDKKGKRTKIGTFTSSVSTISLNKVKNLHSVELKNNTGQSILLYELIWKAKQL